MCESMDGDGLKGSSGSFGSFFKPTDSSSSIMFSGSNGSDTPMGTSATELEGESREERGRAVVEKGSPTKVYFDLTA